MWLRKEIGRSEVGVGFAEGIGGRVKPSQLAQLGSGPS